MKRQLLCMLGAIITSAAVVVGTNYMAVKEIVIHKEVVDDSNTNDDLSVEDYAYDNYSDDFWKTNNYDPVEYVMASVTDGEFSENLEAEAAILIDVATNEVVYEKNPEKRLAPASTTKLATAITAVEILDLNQPIIIGNEINLIAPDSSKAGLEIGESLTFKELLQGMLLSSGNDAAYVIARAAGEKLLNDNIAYEGEDITIQQSIKRFIYEVNKNVRDIGLENTQFTTPDGYDETSQYTTASDLSKIAYIAYQNETIREICDTVKATTEDGDYTFTTTNMLLLEDSDYYYKYANGMKTGSTDIAGKCLVSTATKDDRTCICVVLKSSEEGRYEDSLKLLKHYIQNSNH